MHCKVEHHNSKLRSTGFARSEFVRILWNKLSKGLSIEVVLLDLNLKLIEVVLSDSLAGSPRSTFGTLDRSIIHLYMAMTGGTDWIEQYMAGVGSMWKAWKA